MTGPHNVLGIELNEFAAELARVTVWIGELQWRIQRGYGFKTQPVLEPLDHIECRDAVLNADGTEAAWPKADAVVGNPPFVGDKKMRGELGDAYTEAMRAAYKGRVPGGADLVCYWFEKARGQIAAGALLRAGLVSTNSIRGGKNREVLDSIVKTARIFEAWSDEAWVNDGAAVRVSLVGFGSAPGVAVLNGRDVDAISADLTATSGDSGVDLTVAAKLGQNAGVCFQGSVKVGDFDVTAEVAREWLALPNVHGTSNAEVLRPLRNAKDLTTRPREAWIVDFNKRPLDIAQLFEAPFSHVLRHVKPFRDSNRDNSRRMNWWLHGRTGDDLRSATSKVPRVIVTPRVAKFRTFLWMHARVYVDDATALVARADDATFGALHSRFHELWSLRLGTSLEDRPRYTSTTCFETFPFSTGLTPADTAHQRTEPLPEGALIPADLPSTVRPHVEAIARAAKRLDDLRDAWLNPPEWTERVPEVVPLGMAHSPYPDRIVARPGFEKELAKRTLTNLYNQRPAWLAQAHEALDLAVAAAYGWTDYTPAMPDDEVLRRLLALNLERAGAQSAPVQGQSLSENSTEPNRRRLATEAAGWKGAVVKLTRLDGNVAWRPAAFVYAYKAGITWVEPSYADPYGAASPAMHTCHGTWLDWNHVQGPDWSALVVEYEARRDRELVGDSLAWFEDWLAEEGRTWEQEREQLRRRLKIRAPKGAVKQTE